MLRALSLNSWVTALDLAAQNDTCALWNRGLSSLGTLGDLHAVPTRNETCSVSQRDPDQKREEKLKDGEDHHERCDKMMDGKGNKS